MKVKPFAVETTAGYRSLWRVVTFCVVTAGDVVFVGSRRLCRLYVAQRV